LRLGAQVLAAALSFVIIIGSGWAWATYRSFSANITRINAISNSDHSKAATQNIDGKDRNILIAGNDDRTGYTAAQLAELGTTADGGSENTDTLMLMHVPANGSQATVISFPRDSYVAIPGHGMDKINAAYVDGINDHNGDKAAGAQLLVQTVENLTGLKIDHFVMVNLLGFYNISEAIGGVQVCLNNAMGPSKVYGQTGNGIDAGFEPNGSYVYSYSGINLPKGVSTIEGTQALAFVRQRHGLPNGDLDRIKRQQYFLSAVFHKIESAGTLTNPLRMQNLLKAVSSSLTMDSTLDPLQLAKQMQNLTAGNVRFTTIPILGFDNNSPVGSVEDIDAQAMPAFINNILGIESPLQTATAAKPSTVTVAVANDTNSNNGVEKTNATALKSLGFTATIPPATSTILDKTTIEYPPGSESAAKAVENVVPGAVMQSDSSVSGVVLALGNNGVQVKTLTKSSGSSTPSASAASAASAASSAGSGSPTAPTVNTANQASGCIN
jgi:LCP family protein required for cell wall assembly